MKSLCVWIFVLSYIILSVPGTSAFLPVEDVLAQGEEFATEIGTVYVYYPQEPQEQGTSTQIGAVILYNRTNIQVEVNLENSPLGAVENVTGANFTEEQVLYQQEWVFPTQATTTTITILENGQTILRKPVTITVKEPEVLSENEQESTTLVEEQEENVQNQALDEYTKFTQREEQEIEVIRHEEANLQKTRTVLQRTLSNGSEVFVTKVEIVLQPSRAVEVIEVIPKTVAAHVDELVFEIEPIVLNPDPVIMWQVDAEENTRLAYELQGNATITGNTVLVANVAAGEERETFPWKVIGPILLIPLIGGIIFFFSRFEPKK